ncbi:glyceraldehyde-3-phosphate dehydrogenase [Cognatishimia activa]|nr:glyceraldehyde-3-phosphate dehydrogenase [Cognatishimia activa]UZD89996.1 glyceraldehyde-3-phosphate dehydrogenase [Cognatishimia activa]
MTNSIAIGIVFSLVLALVADQVWLDGTGALFAARKFAELIEWVAFWR